MVPTGSLHPKTCMSLFFTHQVFSNFLTDLKTILPSGDVHGCQVSQGFELRIGVIPEENQHWDDSIRMDTDLQLIETRHLQTRKGRKEGTKSY